MKSKMNDLALSQVEKRLAFLRKSKEHASISTGWIRLIREAMGMTLKDLAKRADLSVPTVSQSEKREIEGKVTLTTLNKLADALECELVYSLVPKKTIKKTIEDSARKKAAECLDEAGLHMKIEAQGVTGGMSERVERLVKKLIEKGDVW